MITNLSEHVRAGLDRIADSSGGHSLAIATQAADLCVAAFADICVIYLRRTEPHCAAFAARDAGYESLRDVHYDDLFSARAKACGLTSVIEEPLLVNGRRIGRIVVGFAEGAPERNIGGNVIELIASMLARAIEQAEELEHHYLISKRLQNALLPAKLAGSDEVTCDAAYRPASDEADVGGDWYDAFELGGGRIGISVGDVTGHGLEAAVAMSEIRRAIRASVALNESPSAVINHVDAIISSEGVGMATAVIAVYDMATGVLRYASAGHPPPALLCDGSAHMLPAGGLLLGLGAAPASGDYWITLSPGSTCFFYTDGLLEYDRDVIAGEAALLAAIETIGSRGDRSAEALHREIFSRAINSDDCATLTVARTDVPWLTSEHLVFSPLPMCAPLARQAVRHFCRCNALSEDRTFDVLTGIGEAVANAIEHGDQDAELPFSIDLMIDETQLIATIESVGHWRAFTAREERGRGIPIMRSCTSHFEIASSHDSTRIRLTFPLTDAR